MKTYGSTTGVAHQIKNFYGAVDHKARLALKVYGPAPMPDSFDTLTIQSGGVGNITGTNPATFTTHIKEADSAFWNDIVMGRYIPLRIEATRSGTSFARIKKLTFIYRHSDSSAEYSYSLLSYTSSSDSNYKSGLERYGFSYKSSLSNGTDVINFTMGYAPKTKLIHKGFAKPNWGEITYYSGYTMHKSLRRSSGTYLEDQYITDIDYDKFDEFLESNNIDTTKTVGVPTSVFSTDWEFTDTNGATVAVSYSSLKSTTGITCSTISWFTNTLYFFDKKVPDPTSQVVTKKLRSGVEYESLCTDGGPMGTGSYTIDGETVAAGSAISFKFGYSAGGVGDGFLAGSKYLTSVDMKFSQMGSIGKYFLMRCPAFDGSISIPNVVSIGDYFLAYCDIFNSSISHSSKLKTIGEYFLAEDSVYNQSFSLSGVTTIGKDFMFRCYSFNKSMTIPSSVTSIGSAFMPYMRDMYSTITCSAAATVAATSNYTFCALNNSCMAYTSGIKLSGTYKSDWQARFPDKTDGSPYRNTDVV